MELDLDTFLQSHDTSTTDDDDEDDHHHQTTVDELLLIHSDDSSTSSSPRSQTNSNISYLNSSNSTQSTPFQSITDGYKPVRVSNPPSVSQINNSGDTFSVSRSRPLFNAVRSTVKPGAALAAAAAASRLILTPHATAIKLNRKNSGNESLDSKAGTGLEISHLVEDDDDRKPDTLETVQVESVEPDTLETVPVESVEPDTLETALSAPVESIEPDTLETAPVKTVKPDTLETAPVETVIPDTLETALVESAETFELSEELITKNESRNEWSVAGEDFPCKDTDSSVGKPEVASPSVLDKVDDSSNEDIKGIQSIKEIDDTSAQADVSVVKNDGEDSLKPLELAEELEKKHAFIGMHWEEGAAAQPMRLEGIHTGSTVLGYFSISADNTITKTLSSPAFRRDHGTPQALAVHHNYIAVGMSRGVIVVVPSKYSPHYADNMDAKMLMLGLQGDRSYAPVTSMSFNQQGDLLFAGYADGHYTVWDVQRVSAAKNVTEHKAPVVHMLYLGMDSQVTRQFNIVSGDSKGVVKLIRCSPFSWLNRFSTSKTTTLLDESTSTVVCASPLISEEGFTSTTSGIGSMVGVDPNLAEEGVVILVTHQSALVAKVVSNTPEVYAQIPKPDEVREGSMPYTAWKYIAPSQGSAAENVHVKESETTALLAIAWDHQVQLAKLLKSELKIYAKWSLDSSAIGVAWLDDQILVVLTSAGQLCLYAANDGTLIHDTSFAVDGGRGDDVIGYHTHFSNVKAHHNCIAIRGASLYLLGPTHLVVSRLLPWKERIEVLRRGGDWMGAFNMAMMLYDGQAHGVFDLPRALDDVQKAIMPYLVELLSRYVDEVFSYVSATLGNHLNGSKSVSSMTSEQYTRVGGVAVEFCVHIKRTDILFGEILSRFESVQQKETFLELLEPYILKDMLGSLPPEIMQALVEHYSTKGWLQRVEQCVLHMDISSLDFNQVVRLCQEHNLYRAMIYLFNKGLDDFRTPLEELLLVYRNNNSESAPSLGYRMLVYLKYCFSGFAFPPGHGTLPPARLPSLRMELIHFLLEDSNAPSTWGLRSLSATESYKNLYHLLELDTEATLDVLRCAFTNEILKSDYKSAVEKGSTSQIEDLIQKTVDVLALVLEPNKSSSVQSDTMWPSKNDIGYMLEFISYFVSCGEAKVSSELLGQIFEYLTSEASILANVERKCVDSSKIREKQVLALLEVVPPTDWDDRSLLDMCEKAHFYQVCGFIHNRKQQYVAALDSFMKDVDEPVHAFSYIHFLLQRKRLDSFEVAVISRIPDLVQLSREGTFYIVECYFREHQQILAELRSHPKSLFLYLKTVIEVHSTGTMSFSSLQKREHLYLPGRTVKDLIDTVHYFLESISEFPKFLRENPVNVTDEMTEQYLELLCQFEPNSVLHFLETCECYRVDHCLRLCQEHKITDAAAFLLERVGDVGSALSFTLSDLVDRFSRLVTAAQSVYDYAGVDHFSEVMKKEVDDILYIVHTCVGLCQRNSSRLDANESEALWFQLLDTFCDPLTNSYVGMMDSEKKDQKESFKTRWKIRGSDKAADILRKLFSSFIKEIVEGMIGYVRLPVVMMKLLSDNGSQEFGDFKPTILGMLGTYDFERKILDTARSLIEDDTYYTMVVLKRGASHGHGPQSLVCCICNCLITKDSSNTGIRVYNCGHASHMQCESHTGCLICMPKKKGVKSRVPSETGLVARNVYKGTSSQGTLAFHLHENDALDRQISRYEILNNLDKDKMVVLVDNMPPLRLEPPAVYHEKVKKGVAMLSGERSNSTGPAYKVEKGKQIKDMKTKGPAVRFSLKSNIFGKEKISRR